jgi:aerobic carbon-monoxide dehydrogenase small subunit
MRPVTEPVDELEVSLFVNGRETTRTVPVRKLLSDFIRDDLGLTGTHVGCEHGVCGACTILLDGVPVRSCILLAVQADGAAITTVEGITPENGLNPLQQAFKDHHGLQCGFCTAGILMTVTGVDPDDYPDDDSIREMLAGNLCRCTGYQNIVAAVRAAWGRATA